MLTELYPCSFQFYYHIVTNLETFRFISVLQGSTGDQCDVHIRVWVEQHISNAGLRL